MSKIALIQMVSSSNVASNLIKMETLMIKAHESGAQLVVLPENFALMGKDQTDKLMTAEVEGVGPIQEKINQLAKRLKLWIVAGTIPIKTKGKRIRASSIVFDDKGVQVARYDKIHLFDARVSELEAHKESDTFEPGSELVVVDTPVGRIGLSVCYDLRFAALYQKLVLKGAQLVTVPSAFTATTGLAHWEILLRARAIENLCYVLAPNQGGQHDNSRLTYGHSMIVEPWGQIMSELPTGEGVLIGDIDLQRQTHLRAQFPCLKHHVL